MYSLILYALFATASGHVIVDAPCPAIKTVDNFDFNAFAQGKWYEISKYPIVIETDDKCSYGEYTSGQGEASVKFYNYNAKGIKRSADGSVRPAPNASGVLIFSLPRGPSGTLTESTFNVLATDNKDYLLGYYCKYDEKKGSRLDLAWLFSRSKTLSSEAEAAIDTYIKSSGFLEKSKFVKNDFSEGACKDI